MPARPKERSPERGCRPDRAASHTMDVLLLLIPLSVVLVLLMGAVFWWSVRAGQFDDLEGPAHRILDDDDTNVAVSLPPE